MKIPLFICAAVWGVCSVGFAAAPKTCSLDHVYGSCDALRTGGPVLKIRKDGTVVPNLFKTLLATEQDRKDPEFQKGIERIVTTPDKEVTQARIEKARKYITEAFVEMALDGRKEDDPKLDEGTKTVLARLRSLTFATADEKTDQCDEMIANAFYSPADHQVKMCNGLAQAPELMLLFITAHEVAHSIDACQSNRTLMKVSADVATKTCDSKNMPNPGALADRAGQYLSTDEFVFHADEIEKCGFAEVVARPVRTAPVSTISKTIDCVTEAVGERVRFKGEVQSLDDMIEMARKSLKEQNPGITDSLVVQVMKNQRASLTEAHAKYMELVHQYQREAMGCSNPFGGHFSQASERSSDQLATLVIKKFIRENKLNDEQKKDLVEFQAQVACGSQLTSGKAFNSPLYPKGDERLQILLQEPEVRALYGCSTDRPSVCSASDVKAGLKPAPEIETEAKGGRL